MCTINISKQDETSRGISATAELRVCNRIKMTYMVIAVRDLATEYTNCPELH